ncbi:hypothetical protein KF728_09740 [Candidatus Obscuribacterales bacterium]|nr:hypothetical protein [Candidatus Obscuribacterales bacterium]
MLKRIVSGNLFTLILCMALALPVYAKSVSVRGYYRKDGTYVRPHMRSSPDGNFYNNWSTKGNYNPYTGEEGTRLTPPGSSQFAAPSSYSAPFGSSYSGYYALPSIPAATPFSIPQIYPSASPPFASSSPPTSSTSNLSSTGSNDFVTSVKQRIQQTFSSYPESDVTAKIYFEVGPSGTASNIKILSASGDSDGVRRAVEAIGNSGPFGNPTSTERFVVSFKNGSIDGASNSQVRANPYLPLPAVSYPAFYPSASQAAPSSSYSGAYEDRIDKAVCNSLLILSNGSVLNSFGGFFAWNAGERVLVSGDKIINLDQKSEATLSAFNDLADYRLIAKTRTVGDFDGADHDKVCQLDNGMILRFDCYHYRYRYRPHVYLFSSGRSLRMILDDDDYIYKVTRVR